jgi:hypothetical protein
MIKIKKIVGWEDYSIGADGRVYSKKRGGTQVELTQTKGTSGYYNVGFSNGKEKKTFQVHRLVASTFLSNRKRFEIVNHLDGNKLNNDVSNLEWTTRVGNAKHAVEKLRGGQVAERKVRKENDMKARISIIDHAHSACTANPELFHSIYKTVMGV